jgi:hypothetical protein
MEAFNEIVIFKADPNILTNGKPPLELVANLFPARDFLLKVYVCEETKEEAKVEEQGFFWNVVHPIIRRHMAAMLNDLIEMEGIYFTPEAIAEALKNEEPENKEGKDRRK